MMEKVGFEKGLIRYASVEGIENKTGFQITNRVKAYSIVLVLLMGALVYMLLSRSDFEATVLRTRGTLFQKLEDGIFRLVKAITMSLS